MNYKRLIIVIAILGLTACSPSEDGLMDKAQSQLHSVKEWFSSLFSRSEEASLSQISASMASIASTPAESTTTTETPTTNDLTVVNIIRTYAEYGMGVDWKTVQIKGIQWSDINTVENGYFPFEMTATADIKGLGESTITWSGPRSMVYQGRIAAPRDGEAPNFKTIIGPSTKIKKIRGLCDGEGSSDYSNVYQVNLNSAKPVYIKEEMSSGASSSTYELYIDSNVNNFKCDEN